MADAPAITHDWFTAHIPVWTRLLAPLAGRAGVRALEIGCFEGRATSWLLANVLTGEGSGVDCVDTFEGSDEYASMGVSMAGVRERFEANVAPWRDRVSVHVGRSADVVRRMDGRYDLVYVDASHTAPDVIADAVLAWPLLPAGGVMIFDDYAWDWFARPERNPRIAVDAFRACYAGRYQLLHAEYQVAVRKLAGYSEAVAATILPRRPQGQAD